MTMLKLLNTEAKKATQTSLDTLLITPEVVKKWRRPEFQRPVRVTNNVRKAAEKIKQDGGVLPGVITIGIFRGEKYLVDGQHRCEAFLLTGLAEGYCDVRYHVFDTMAQMGQEWNLLQGQLVSTRPDDKLRGLEQSIQGLSLIRQRCPFVGYDMIRRSEKAPVLSMSTLLSCWVASANETPSRGGDGSVQAKAESLTVDSASTCCDFLDLAFKAWGRDPEYARLWSTLNLSICMWVYRRVVLETYSFKIKRVPKELFAKCLTSLSADSSYLDWLVGRNLSERDRSPAYARIKAILVKRMKLETGLEKIALPQPAWASHGASR
jgi:hypothetical protein